MPIRTDAAGGQRDCAPLLGLVASALAYFNLVAIPRLISLNRSVVPTASEVHDLLVAAIHGYAMVALTMTGLAMAVFWVASAELFCAVFVSSPNRA
jgi:hypothetical protein